MIPTFTRRSTHPVFIGQVGVGGRFPIRIQSMLTSDTKDTAACLKEMRELVDTGCEIIRLTVPTKADLDNLKNIRAAMRAENLTVPLVADIHFTPSIALEVVDHVEKVRINPGNFADKKLFQKTEYTDAEYAAELDRIAAKFTPLVQKCKQRQVAMRIGTNHGSLSDRILNRYGDTPLGMVESALEFLRIAHQNSYRDIILSMKAANVQVMVTAYRLLAQRLAEEGLPAYPFHLGVTEAGDGEDARIKSAIGIGTLLEEGLGDTIRVSLTEDSVYEIPVAYAIAAPYNAAFAQGQFEGKNETPQAARFPLSYARRTAEARQIGQMDFGATQTVRVWASYGPEGFDHAALAQNSDPVFEGVEFWPCQVSDDALQELQQQNRAVAILSSSSSELMHTAAFAKRGWIIKAEPNAAELRQVIQHCQKTNSHLELCLSCEKTRYAKSWLKILDAGLRGENFTNVSFSLLSPAPLQHYKILVDDLKALGRADPIHLRFADDDAAALLQSSIQLGGLLIDGIGDSLQIMRPDLGYAERLRLSYGILQASRVRMFKTEYIACPSCGRTQFNLQHVTAQIKACTDHLKGVKIGIMGCIVNGPGEMADADFGYVGTGLGKISLYVGQNCVERNIPEQNAVHRLLELIRAHGKWVEPHA